MPIDPVHELLGEEHVSELLLEMAAELGIAPTSAQFPQFETMLAMVVRFAESTTLLNIVEMALAEHVSGLLDAREFGLKLVAKQRESSEKAKLQIMLGALDGVDITAIIDRATARSAEQRRSGG